MKNTSKNRAFKWILASVLLCALLVCAWTVAAGAEDPQHEHEYKLYVDWSEDTTKEPTISNTKLKCKNCPYEVEIPSKDIKVEELDWVSDATCTQPGMRTYKAQTQYNGTTYEIVSENAYPGFDSKPLGHTYDVVPEGFALSADKKTATAIASCYNGCTEQTEGHTATITATVTGSEYFPGTCQKRSWWRYDFSYELNGVPGYTGYVFVDGDYGDHDYALEGDWSTDTTKEPTISNTKLKCKNCPHEVEIPSKDIKVETWAVASDATCTKPRMRTYKAQTQYNGTTYETVSENAYSEFDSKPLGHLYGMNSEGFTLSADKKTATATAVCYRTGCTEQTEGHTTTVTATVTGSEYHPGDCQSISQWEYHLSYTLNDITVDDNTGGNRLNVDGDYGDHDYALEGDWSTDTTKEPTISNAKLKCKNCPHEVEIPSKDIKVEKWAVASVVTCTKPQMCIYEAQTQYNGTTYETVSENAYPEFDSKPAGHLYSMTSEGFTLSADKKTATAMAVCNRTGCTEQTEGHTTTVTATVTGSQKVVAGDCQNPSRWRYDLSYDLNGVSGRYACVHIDGDYGDHSFTTKASAQLAHAATCTKAAEYYVQCDLCDAVSETKTVGVGAPLAHSYKLTTGFTPSANGMTATAAAVCESCQDRITVTAERGRMVGQAPGTCEEHAWQEIEYYYTLNGKPYVTSGLREEGDYGDHDFTELVTLNGKQVRECSICGELEGVEELSALSGELTGSHPVQADHIEVRYGVLANGKKALVIMLVDRYGDAVSTMDTCEVEIPLAELNALLGEDITAHKLYWNDPWTKELVPVEYTIENGKLRLNVTFKNSSLCVLTLD